MKVILAVDENNAIGFENDQLYYIKKDLAHFKELTSGKILIMGRKTFEALGAPLKGRTNIVLTRKSDYFPPGIIVKNTREEVLDFLKDKKNQAFVIGGGQVVDLFLDQIDEAHITKIYDSSKKADTYLHDFSKDPDFFLKEESETMEEGGITFKFLTYERKEK